MDTGHFPGLLEADELLAFDWLSFQLCWPSFS